jgi:uncharacterized membrane protein YphA (DoxX/SURF4 family)
VESETELTNLKHGIGRLALIAIGLVFLAAGGLKALNPEGFTETVRGYGLLPGGAAPLVTYTLVPLEVALGVTLILGFMRRWAVGAAVVILLGFLGLMGYIWATGGDISECGCFGSLVERTPVETILEDLLFMGIALLGLLARREEGKTGALQRATAPAVAVMTAAFLPLAAGVPVEALEVAMAKNLGWNLSLVTRLTPGMTEEELRLSLPDTAISEGRHLVSLLDLEVEEVSGPVTEALNVLAGSPGAPSVAVLYSNDEEIKDAFFWSHAPSFPMYQVLPEEMRGLYRRLPRFFLMEDGIVTDVWDAMPVAETLVAAAGQVQEMSP